MIVPPPLRADLVTNGLTPHPLRLNRCDQMNELLPHSPPTFGCTNATKSTKPSSSPEFGLPSGPSLSNCPQSRLPLSVSVSFSMSGTFACSHSPLHPPL